jgi:hypothetical protein
VLSSCLTWPLTRSSSFKVIGVEARDDERAARTEGVGPLARHHCRSPSASRVR